MYIRQFEYLVALSATRNFSRAADQCHVSQAGLSNAIRQLEEELGTMIIVRDHRFHGFTVEGTIILKWAQQLINDLSQMRQEITAIKMNFSGNLRIGASPSCSPMLPFITNSVTQAYPDMTISISFLGIDILLTKILNYEIDLGIGCLNFLESSQIGIGKRILYSDDLVLLVSTSNKDFAKKQSATWAEAATLPLCLMPQSTDERRIVDSVLAGGGFNIKPQVEADSFVNLAFHVMNCQYATVVPGSFRNAIGAFPRTHIVRLIQPSVQQKMGLFWVESKPPNQLIKAMVSAVDRISDARAPWTSQFNSSS